MLDASAFAIRIWRLGLEARGSRPEKSEDLGREIAIRSRLEIRNWLECLLLSSDLNRAFSIRRLCRRGRGAPRPIPNLGTVLLFEFCRVRIAQG